MSSIPPNLPVESTPPEGPPPRRASRLGRGLAGLVGMEPLGSSGDDVPALAISAGTLMPAVTTNEEDIPRDGDLLEIAVDALVRNPYQPRKDFDAEALAELAKSIAQHGVLQPLLVRPLGGGSFQLIAGERRWLAAREAELEIVPCQVRHYTDQQVYETAMEENLKREDLNPLEQAHAFRRYLDEFDSTIEQLAKRLSMSRSAISNLLRLLELSEPVQQALREGQISAGHARSLVTLEPGDQLSLCNRIVEEGLTVRATESAAREIRLGVVPIGIEIVDPDPVTKSAPPELTNHLAGIQEHLRSLFGTKVEIRLTDNQVGRIVIPFDTGDDFQRVLRVLQRRAA